MTVFGMRVKGFRQFSGALGIWTKFCRAKGTFVVARKFPLAILGGNEVRCDSHVQVYALSLGQGCSSGDKLERHNLLAARKAVRDVFDIHMTSFAVLGFRFIRQLRKLFQFCRSKRDQL